MTEDVYKQQLERERHERVTLEQSRTSSEQRLDNDGNPANLFELLKKDPSKQGYRLENVYFLQLNHKHMAFLPAVIHAERRVIICLARGLLIKVWKTLEPRSSKMNSEVYYINDRRGIAYLNTDEPFERESIRPEKILTPKEYETIQGANPKAIAWAPGLIGGQYIKPADFSAYVDRMAADCL